MTTPPTSPSSPTSPTARAPGRDGALNLVGAVCQQASTLAVTLLVARVLGEQALGRYVIVWATLTLLSLTCLLGFRAALNRFVAVHLADDEPDRVWALVRLAVGVAGGLAVLTGGTLLLVAGDLAEVFGDPGLERGFVAAGVALPAFVLRDVALAATQGWRDQRAFALIGWIGEPLTRLGLTAAALAAGGGVGGAWLALVVAAWAAAAAAAVVLRRRLGVRPPVLPRAQVRRVLGFSMVTWGTTLAATGLIWVDALLLGALGDAADVGVYAVATRLVGLAVLTMAPIDALMAPRFARLAHLQDAPGLAAAYTASITWTLRLSLPAFVVVVVYADPLLRVFGPSFASGVTVTVVLACGQLCNAATGPAGSLLLMSGRTWLNLADNVVGLLLNVLLNLLLIPAHGIVGAAMAWTVSLSALNLAKALQVRVLLHLDPVSRQTLRPVAATLVAILPVVALRAWLPASLTTTVLGALVLLVVYLLATAWRGLEPHERQALRTLRDQRRPRGPGPRGRPE